MWIIMAIVIVAFFALGGTTTVFMIKAFRDQAARDAANDQLPVIETKATVVIKRIRVWNEQTTYYVTFEMQGGKRHELHVDGSSYGQLVEQDHGILMVQGKRYLGFERDCSRP